MSEAITSNKALQADQLTLAELLSSLSYALDITEGQPEGHCIRACWIGMHVGKHIGMKPGELWELYYTLLLKDLGCSSNAARISELYLADDRRFKKDFKQVDRGVLPALKFVMTHTGLQGPLGERLRAVAGILSNGSEIVRELIETRCTRGADIARQLRFPESVAMGIQHLDEHWDGYGRPAGVRGEKISLYARIALLAQVVDVFSVADGPFAAVNEVKKRTAYWFDPKLCEAFLEVAKKDTFWEALKSPDLHLRIFALEPAKHAVGLDEQYLDDIAAAFGQVIDAKSPFTAGHSERVATYVDAISRKLGMPDARRRWLRRGALLHDMGKLGVSNVVLDKPGPLTPGEWVEAQQHATYTRNVLSRITIFKELADVAAAHHERPDGLGYPKGLPGDQVTLETRIITAADIFDALTSKRPWRPAMTVEQALETMRGELGTKVDYKVFEALESSMAKLAR
jgi:putative nucleotidyltransferase with HDIG domain